MQRLNPQQFDPAIDSLKSTYWPQTTAFLGTQSIANPPTAGTIGIPVGATSVTQGTSTFNGGYLQNMRRVGGQLNLSINNIRSTTTSTTALYNPAYLPTYSATFTQPLLRGLTIDPNRQQILVTRIGRDISDLQLKATIINAVTNVREAYWNYVYSVEAVGVAEQALDLAGSACPGQSSPLGRGFHGAHRRVDRPVAEGAGPRRPRAGDGDSRGR